MNIQPEQWHNGSDALIASSQHHKLLLENEFVRVLDANIPPGEMTTIHTHQFAASHIVISWSDFLGMMPKAMYCWIQEACAKIFRCIRHYCRNRWGCMQAIMICILSVSK